MRYREGEVNLTQNMEIRSSAYPYPKTFQWYLNGNAINNDSRRMFGYPSMTIMRTRRSDSGIYTLRASNYYVDDPSKVVGTAQGWFTLDIFCECNYGHINFVNLYIAITMLIVHLIQISVGINCCFKSLISLHKIY